jgi:hypothetical protein
MSTRIFTYDKNILKPNFNITINMNLTQEQLIRRRL